MVRRFRGDDGATPIVLMGYFNPIYSYGCDRFVRDAVDCGVDGLIIVDLPPEEDTELCLPAIAAGLNWIRLATPTTDARRRPTVLSNSSGFVYYVAILGITGTGAAMLDAVTDAVESLRAETQLPIAVGFGINTPEQAGAIAGVAAAAVVGSAVVRRIRDNLDAQGRPQPGLVSAVHDFVGDLARGVRGDPGA